MSLCRIAVDRAESMAIVMSDMRVFAFKADARPALAANPPPIGTTVEFFPIDDDGLQRDDAVGLIRSVRAVLDAELCPTLAPGSVLLVLDAPGTSDQNYAEALQLMQRQQAWGGAVPSSMQALADEQVKFMQAQDKALEEMPTRRERLAGAAMQSLIRKYEKGDAELHSAHVADQAVTWADALIARLAQS